MIPDTIEPAVRRILASLRPDEILPTGALALRVEEMTGMDQRTVAGHLIKLANNVPGLCTRTTTIGKTGYMKGKKLRPCHWHRIDSPDMPTTAAGVAAVRLSDSLAGTSRSRREESAGAASPGASLADRVQALEQWRARFDPLSTVL